MVLNVPSGDNKSQSYGFWFHYLLNERSKRAKIDGSGKAVGEPVSIATVLSYTLSAEAGVPGLYNKTMPYMVKALAHKGWMDGFYTAIGGRQVVREDMDNFIFLPRIDKEHDPYVFRVKERNWNGSLNGEEAVIVDKEI
jgi:hypothetical protein